MTASRVSIERSEARSEMMASRVGIERSEARSEMAASAMTTRARRELGAACLLTLGGAVLVLLATSGSAGAAAVPAARGPALVGLAGAVALLAARGWSRLAVGLVLVIAGLGLVAAAVSRPGAPALRVAIIGTGGVLVLVAGSLSVVRGRGWPALGARYDAPEPGRRAAAGDVWDALDRGEDPTDR